MPQDRVSVVIFEGGGASSPVEEQIVEVRKALVADLVGLLQDVDGVDEVILGTNYPDLAATAETCGALVDIIDLSPFHFGEALKLVVDRHGLTRVIYLGGAAMPLLRSDDWAAIAHCVRVEDDVVVVNNVQSADLVAFTPTSALDGIDLPPSDNFLGYLLREYGLRRVLIPNSSRANFDLDTPADLLLLKLQTRVSLGPATTAALTGLEWDSARLERVWNRLAVPDTEVALIGRVGPPVVTTINAALRCRVRVYSEERGMKALGREEKGQVVSLLGGFMDEVGPARFFTHLSDVADLALIDSRVLMAHWKEPMTASDRFYSDLGQPDRVENPKLKQFTEAYLEARIPVVCGGHNLVSGGLWVMVEEIAGPVPGDAETL